MTILGSSYWEASKDSSLSSRVFSSIITTAAWKNDLRKCRSYNLLEAKFDVYRWMELEKMMEYYLRKVFQKYIVLERQPQHNFVFQYPASYSMSKIDYLLGVDAHGYGLNMIGCALRQRNTLWRLENVEYLYKAFHVIEFLIQYYRTHRELNCFYHLSVFQLFDQQKLGSPRCSDWKDWLDQFDDKSWLYTYLLERELDNPGSLCFRIERWYTPFRNCQDEEEILLTYGREWKKNAKIEDPRVFLQEGLRDHTLARYYDKNVRVSALAGKKIAELEFNQLTTREIKERSSRYPYQHVDQFTQVIRHDDSLSPFRKQEIEMHGRSFSSMIEYMFYACMMNYASSEKDALEILASSHYNKSICQTVEFFLDRQFHLEMYRKLDELPVQYALVDPSTNLDDFPAEADIFREKKQELHSLTLQEGYEKETLYFVHGLVAFLAFWTEEMQTKYACMLLKLYAGIYFPALFPFVSSKTSSVEAHMPLLDYVEEPIMLMIVPLLQHMDKIEHASPLPDFFSFVRKLPDAVQDEIINRVTEWQQCLCSIYEMADKKYPTVLNANFTRGKNYRGYLICKTLYHALQVSTSGNK